MEQLVKENESLKKRIENENIKPSEVDWEAQIESLLIEKQQIQNQFQIYLQSEQNSKEVTLKALNEKISEQESNIIELHQLLENCQAKIKLQNIEVAQLKQELDVKKKDIEIQKDVIKKMDEQHILNIKINEETNQKLQKSNQLLDNYSKDNKQLKETLSHIVLEKQTDGQKKDTEIIYLKEKYFQCLETLNKNKDFQKQICDQQIAIANLKSDIKQYQNEKIMLQKELNVIQIQNENIALEKNTLESSLLEYEQMIMPKIQLFENQLNQKEKLVKKLTSENEKLHGELTSFYQNQNNNNQITNVIQKALKSPNQNIINENEKQNQKLQKFLDTKSSELKQNNENNILKNINNNTQTKDQCIKNLSNENEDFKDQQQLLSQNEQLKLLIKQKNEEIKQLQNMDEYSNNENKSDENAQKKIEQLEQLLRVVLLEKQHQINEIQKKKSNGFLFGSDAISQHLKDNNQSQ